MPFPIWLQWLNRRAGSELSHYLGTPATVFNPPGRGAAHKKPEPHARGFRRSNPGREGRQAEGRSSGGMLPESTEESCWAVQSTKGMVAA